MLFDQKKKIADELTSNYYDAICFANFESKFFFQKWVMISAPFSVTKYASKILLIKNVDEK